MAVYMFNRVGGKKKATFSGSPAVRRQLVSAIQAQRDVLAALTPEQQHERVMRPILAVNELARQRRLARQLGSELLNKPCDI